MIIDCYEDLVKFNMNDLIKIALFNKLFDNSYYISKKEILQCFYSHLMIDYIIIPDCIR